MKPFLLVIGAVMTALALVAVAIPGVPSTPFALTAAWCFTRASPRAEAWLYAHPWLGPSLTAWRDQRAIPARAKGAAVAMMASSWAFTAVYAPMTLAAGVGALLLGVGAFVVTRPTPV